MADVIDRLLPADDDPLPEGDSELDALEDSLDAEGTDAEDLVLGIAEPPPLGRTVLFDHGTGLLVRSGISPLVVRGIEGLLGWVTKCLQTERGSSPIHPPDYGLVGVTAGIGAAFEDPELADLEQRVRDAVTFHPRISDIEGWTDTHDVDDDWVAYSTVLVLDDETRIPINGVIGA